MSNGVRWTVEEYEAWRINHDKTDANSTVPWSVAELAQLTDYYQTVPDESFNLSELAARLGRSVDAITIKAGRVGLVTRIDRKKTEQAKEKMKAGQKIRNARPEEKRRRSESMKQRIATNGNHAPNRGKHHTAETKAILSKKTAEHWKNPDAYHNQDAYRQSLSDRFSGMKRPEVNYSRGSGGRRKDLDNRYFRSMWEANYARYLNFLKSNGDIFKWEYEPDTFWFESIKRGTRSYTPDFKIWPSEKSEPHYEEIKGWFDKRSQTKMKRMAKFYPNVKVVLIGEAIYLALAKSIKALIPHWESKRRS